MMPTTHITALQVLYSMAATDRSADLCALARALGSDCRGADAVLCELEQLGLVDAERVRLTLPGLAIAVSIRAARRGRPPSVRRNRRAGDRPQARRPLRAA